MFNLEDTIELVLPTADGDKICEVKHPTDAQWAELYSKRSTLIRNMGRGQNETKQLNKEVAAEALLEQIQLNKAVKFDSYEAVTLIDQLGTCDVVDVQRENRSYVVTLSTLLGDVTHTVKIPSHKDLQQASDASARVRGGRQNTTTISIMLRPTADLYDSIVEHIEGYNTDDVKSVPIIHKHRVIDALQGEISQIVTRAKSSVERPTSPGQTSQTSNS